MQFSQLGIVQFQMREFWGFNGRKFGYFERIIGKEERFSDLSEQNDDLRGKIDKYVMGAWCEEGRE